MSTQPLTLIDKQDNFEIVANEIAAILKTEAAAQVALATTAGKPDPSLWDLRVFQDRANPWESFPNKEDNAVPIINVWYESSNFEGQASTPAGRQRSGTLYNIDVYGYGVSENNPAGGHTAGDAASVAATKRAIRLVRNILMSSRYTYLGQRGLVGKRVVESISMFQPQRDDENTHHVAGARIAFRVDFDEYSPQYQPETLELVSLTVSRSEDNEVLIRADFDYS